MVGKDDGKTCTYEIVVIHSIQWPGFFTIINTEKQRWSHLYLGMLNKAYQTFIPEFPPDFLVEPNDLGGEVKEPHDKPKVDNPNVDADGNPIDPDNLDGAGADGVGADGADGDGADGDD